MVRQQITRRRDPRRAGEVAGATTAECAAVCCCVPCSVMEMLVLAAYKVPAGLVKNAIRNRKRRLLQKKKKSQTLLLDHGPASEDNIGLGLGLGLGLGPTLEDHLAKDVAEEKLEASKLEEEMWAQFNGTGFWRSASQRQQQQQQKTQDLGTRVDIPLAQN